MKRIPILLPMVAALLFSCTGEPDGNDGNVRAMEIQATFSGSGAVWEDGDAVSVLSGGKLTKFSASDSDGGSCTLSGRAFGTGEISILFPYSTSNTVSEYGIAATLPSTQKAVLNGSDRAAAIATGRADNKTGTAELESAVALVRFALDAEGADGLVSVSLESTDQTPLSGKAAFPVPGDDSTVRVVEGFPDVLLQGPFEAGEYCFTVLPGVSGGLDITLTKESGKVSMHCTLDTPLAPGSAADLGLIRESRDKPDYEQHVISVQFSNGTSFMNPFESPDLLKLSSTMKSPSYPAQRIGMKLSEADGGYSFYAFGTAGLAKNSGGGLCIGSSAGDYLEFPGVEGMYLTGVVLTSGAAVSGVCIEGDDGSKVRGGGVVQSAAARGSVVEWTIYGSEKGRSYRLVNASSGSVAIQKVELKYGPYPEDAPSGKISPLDFGLKQAKTGEEAFEALYNAHLTAVGIGVELDYTGVGTVELVIPSNAKSIPLPRNTNFCGAVFKVLNTSKKIALFSLSGTFKPVAVTGQQIDGADYSAVAELSTGLHILRVQDDSLWVANREGYDYGATRRDVVLVRDGKGSNGPCAPYSTPATRINAACCETDEARKSIVNATLERDARSTVITNFLSITGQNNLYLGNLTVRTPSGTGLYGDAAIGIQNCTNILCEDVTFDGLYNNTDEYGYGFSCNNCWNSTFRRITSHTLWAGFGCNNMNDSFLEDSDVERFDTHCYGRNITIRNTTLTGKGIPTASMFGRILCENVRFVNCYVYSMRSDYNSYVPFDIILKDCEFNPKNQTALINMGRLDTKVNSRPELSKKNWPNLEIDGLKVNLPSGTVNFAMFHLGANPTWPAPVGYISSVKIKGLTYTVGGKSADVPTLISRKTVSIENKLVLDADNPGYNITTNLVTRSSASVQ